MECCNSKNSHKGFAAQCNTCGKTGKPVKRETLEHLLKEDRVSLVRDTKYYFCQTPHCDVVYFSRNSDTFYKADLKVRVGLKETEEPIAVCYCFGYTTKMIKEDFLKNGHSTIQKEITNNVKQGICRCEVTNPQGTCCLGNVVQVVKSIITPL
ncbi:MAG: hypothetical protein NUV74_01715 [Candidatus Brocadiaceae bacterium]|nr:hypothetical protein [Candidatus Brocadiaceae bacterium]